MDASGRGIDRRTVLTAAAWSVPVIAVGISAPAAAASAGDITIDFAAVVLQLRRSDTVAGVIAITNEGPALAGQTVQITLTGLARPEDAAYTTSFGPIVGTVDRGDGSQVSTVNGSFVPTPADDGRELVLTAPGFSLPAGTVFIAVLFTWPAENEQVDGFIIGGSFTIRGGDGSTTAAGALSGLTLLPPAAA